MNYKIGDRLRCIEELGGVTVGKIYTIKFHWKLQIPYIPIDKDPDNGYTIESTNKYFELVKENLSEIEKLDQIQYNILHDV